MSPLVSVGWLQQNLSEPNTVILDASVNKIVGMEAIKYETFSCIPNAQFCDIAGAFHLANSSLSNTMPSEKQFSEQARELGINGQSIIVIYDNQGIYSAPRAWWMFKSMGFEQVYVLNGGLPAWLAQGYETQNQYKEKQPQGDVIGHRQQDSIVTAQQVLTAIDLPEQQIVDARSFSRFCGTAKEPRPGLRAGHIPNSVCIHFASLLDQGHYKSDEEIIEIFEAAKLNKENQLIASCGSGMTACIVLLAAYRIGFSKLSLYDGSWSEWGADHSLPVAILDKLS